MSAGPSAWDAWHRGEPVWGLWNQIDDDWAEDCFDCDLIYADKADADDVVEKFSSVAYPIEVRPYPRKQPT